MDTHIPTTKTEGISITGAVVVGQSATRLKDCLAALANSTYPIAQLVVVDNASSDNTVGVVEAGFPDVEIVRSERNLGFAGGVNLGLARATGDLVAVVNPDVVVQPNWLAELVSICASRPDVGIAGGKLLFGDGRTIQHAGGILRYPLALTDHYGYRELDVGRFDRMREVDYVTGAAVVAKREILQSLGGLDEGFYPAYFEETDLCWRIREAGFKVAYVPTAVGIHYESISAVRDSYNYYYFYHRNRLRFVLKHYTADQFLGDFFPAEANWLTSVRPLEEKKALIRAYQEAAEMSRHENLLAVSGGETAVHEAIDQLGRKASELFGGCGGRREIAASRVAALGASSQVMERPFVSNARLVGPAIVKFREAWNWVSTKWYVRQVVQQQNQVNAQIVEASTRLVDCVAELEERLAELQRYIGEVEQMAILADRRDVELTRDLAELRHRIRRLREPYRADLGESNRAREQT